MRNPRRTELVKVPGGIQHAGAHDRFGIGLVQLDDLKEAIILRNPSKSKNLCLSLQEAENAEIIWNELVLQDSTKLFHRVERDYNDLMLVVKRLDDRDGFRLIKETKSLNLKTYLLQEEGSKRVSLKYEVSRAKIPFFNLLCMIYETGMYELWFPSSIKSFDVRFQRS